MKTALVTFLANCANDAKGETKRIDRVRAIRLERGGYLRIVEDETAEAPENAEQRLPRPRVQKTEQRG